MTPVKPPNVNKKMNPIAHNIGVVNLIDPAYIVPNQLKILIPVGTAILGIGLVSF